MDQTGHVHLLLGAPGHPPAALPESPWRLWVLAEAGPLDLAAAVAHGRHSPMTPRAERALVAAVAADDVDGLGRLAATPGPLQEVAQVLYAGRMVSLDPTTAAEVLIALVASAFEPSTSKVLRRHWPSAHVATGLAPGVPALVPLSRMALGLLLAELCSAQGRPVDAVAVLRQLPPAPPVILALAATLLTMGEHAQVLEATFRLANIDDISALALVARSVAARTQGDMPTALDAVSAALAVPERSPAVLAAALEERAHIYTSTGEDIAARADLEILASLAGGDTVEIPESTPITGPDREARPVEENSLDRARERIRRRISAAGAPGTFGGRHHSTYRDELAEMLSLGKHEAAEELLLGLLDAVEDEVSETGTPLDPTYFLTLADLYQDAGRTQDLLALQERFEVARDRAESRPAPVPPAGEGGTAPGAPSRDPFAAPVPVADQAVSLDGQTVDVGAAIEQLLVSVGVAPAGGAEPGAAVAAPRPAALPPLPPAPEPDPVLAPEPDPEAVHEPDPEPEPAAVLEPEPDPPSDEAVAAVAPEAEPEAHAEPVAEETAAAGADQVPDAAGPDDGAEVEVEEAEASADAGDAAEPDDGGEDDDEPPTPPEPRPMSLLERTMRGPRVRSL